MRITKYYLQWKISGVSIPEECLGIRLTGNFAGGMEVFSEIGEPDGNLQYKEITDASRHN